MKSTYPRQYQNSSVTDGKFRDEEGREAKARRAVRTNNFTQQTNALDVDKHMQVICIVFIVHFASDPSFFIRMAYIEENLKLRIKPKDNPEKKSGPADPQDELFHIADKWKVEKKDAGEGSVTNSLTMLTAIPEVDLGMEYVQRGFSMLCRITHQTTVLV
jgi:Hepatocellular carcinoma-associated antigen 59